MVKTRCSADEVYDFVVALRPIVERKALNFFRQFEAQYFEYSLWLEVKDLSVLGCALTQEQVEAICHGKACLETCKSAVEEWNGITGPRRTPAGIEVFRRYPDPAWQTSNSNPYAYEGPAPPPPYDNPRPPARSSASTDDNPRPPARSSAHTVPPQPERAPPKNETVEAKKQPAIQRPRNSFFRAADAPVAKTAGKAILAAAATMQQPPPPKTDVRHSARSLTPPPDRVRLSARSLSPSALPDAAPDVVPKAAPAAQMDSSSDSCSQSPIRRPGCSWVGPRVPRVTASIPWV